MKKLMCLIALGAVCALVAVTVEELCAHGAPKKPSHCPTDGECEL